VPDYALGVILNSPTPVELVPSIQALSSGVVDRVVETDADFHSASILYAREPLERRASQGADFQQPGMRSR
jgi:hypothetical protein